MKKINEYLHFLVIVYLGHVFHHLQFQVDVIFLNEIVSMLIIPIVLHNWFLLLRLVKLDHVPDDQPIRNFQPPVIHYVFLINDFHYVISDKI